MRYSTVSSLSVVWSELVTSHRFLTATGNGRRQILSPSLRKRESPSNGARPVVFPEGPPRAAPARKPVTSVGADELQRSRATGGLVTFGTGGCRFLPGGRTAGRRAGCLVSQTRSLRVRCGEGCQYIVSRTSWQDVRAVKFY